MKQKENNKPIFDPHIYARILAKTKRLCKIKGCKNDAWIQSLICKHHIVEKQKEEMKKWE